MMDVEQLKFWQILCWQKMMIAEPKGFQEKKRGGNR